MTHVKRKEVGRGEKRKNKNREGGGGNRLYFFFCFEMIQRLSETEHFPLIIRINSALR